jgi:hypothetical protein
VTADLAEGIAMTNAARFLTAAAFLLCAAPTFAQTAAEPPPKAEKGTTLQLNCVDESNHDVGAAMRSIYRIELSNKCEQRLQCKIFAYAITGKGPSKGRATLVLAPKSHGAKPQFYDFKIDGTGGMTTVSRECKVI